MLAAKNSNDCSTHRWTTHQRQKSVMVKDLLDLGQRDHAEGVQKGDVDGRGPDQILQPDGPRPELPGGLAQGKAPVGHKARNTSRLHSMSPTKKPICQARPSWM